MLLRVCFVASFLQKYGCIRFDSQGTICFTSLGFNRKVIPCFTGEAWRGAVQNLGQWLHGITNAQAFIFSCSTIHSLLVLPHHFNTAATVQASFSHKHRQGRLIIFRSPSAQLFICPKARPGPMATQTQRKLRPSALSRGNGLS